jgi:hypothetical protein
VHCSAYVLAARSHERSVLVASPCFFFRLFLYFLFFFFLFLFFFLLFCLMSACKSRLRI